MRQKELCSGKRFPYERCEATRSIDSGLLSDNEVYLCAQYSLRAECLHTSRGSCAIAGNDQGDRERSGYREQNVEPFTGDQSPSESVHKFSRPHGAIADFHSGNQRPLSNYRTGRRHFGHATSAAKENFAAALEPT